MKKKFLIISTNALGDTYLSASAVTPIFESFNNAEIHFVAPIQSKALLNHLNVDFCYCLNKKNVFSIMMLVIKIRKVKYDYVFTFFPGIANTLLFNLSRSFSKAGFYNFIKKKQWYYRTQKGVLKGNKKLYFCWKPEMNYLSRISGVLNLVGIKSKINKKPIFFTNNEENRREEENFITIHFKSRDNNRSLSNGDLIKLCEYLWQNFKLKITLLGVIEDFNPDLIRSLKDKHIHFCINAEFTPLLSEIINSKIFIGIDSFPLHIADAYNINFIGIFGPTFPKSVLVNNKKSIIFDFDKYLKPDLAKLISVIAKFM